MNMQRGRIQWELVATEPDCGADRPDAPALEGPTAFNFTLPLLARALHSDLVIPGQVAHPGMTTEGSPRYPPPRIIARRASARPISTKAEVTSGPPTRMRVGVFILFHS